jgi:hypothetical protein
VLLDTRSKTILFRGGNLNGFKRLGHTLFMGRGLLSMVMTNIPSDANRHTKEEIQCIWNRVGDLNCYSNIRIFPVRGGGTIIYGHDLHCTYHHMILDTRNNNIYVLGCEFQLCFELFGYLMFKEGQNHPLIS